MNTPRILRNWLLAGLVLSFGLAAKASDAVVPINWSSFTASAPTDTNSTRIKNIVRNANKYAVNSWYNTVKNYDSQGGTYLSFGGTSEPNIRPSAGQAFALAVSLTTGAYDATYTGVSAADAKAIALKLTRSLAYRHVVNTSGGWGNDWQTAMWAAYAGTAGWLLWDELSTTDREYIRLMVEHEANRFNSSTPPVYRNLSGTVVSSGDSKGEENSWNGMVLQLAPNMMPNHPNATTWLSKAVEYMISAYSRPSDLTNTTVLHGREIKDWLVLGTNIEENGTMINHSIIHPDYAATVSSNLTSSLIFTLAGNPTPQAALFNAAVIYDALVDLNFSAPPYVSPGGTIYTDSSESLYYPQGNDWGTSRRMNYAALDGMATFLGIDSLASDGGAVWEPLHAQKVLDMQGRFSDGHTYLNNTEDDYSGKEEWVAYLAGRAWLTKWISAQSAYTTTNAPYGSLPLVDTFADGNDDGWTRVSGTWSVSGAEYNQTGTSGTATSLVGSSSWSDYAINVKVKHVASGSGTMGLTARWQDANNYYFIAYDRAAANLKLYKKVANSNTQLGSTYAFSWTSGTYRDLRLSLLGGALRVSVNGTEVISTTDTAFTSGRPGIRSYNNAATFDDVDVIVTYGDSFSDGNDDGWTTAGGSWSVSSGEYLQTSTSGTATSLIDVSGDADYTISAKIKNATSGSGTMGLTARWQDSSNYYFVAYDRVAANLKLYKKVGGANTQLGSTYSFSWTGGTTRTLAISLQGSALDVLLDGVAVITVPSDTAFSSGAAGVRSYNNTATFDDVALF